jgi:hypothetical protein
MLFLEEQTVTYLGLDFTSGRLPKIAFSSARQEKLQKKERVS